MATTLPPVPAPPTVGVQRFTPDGRPTTAQVTYEKPLQVFLLAVKRYVESQP